MKSIIWIFILIWLIFKIVELFNSPEKKRKNFAGDSTPDVHNEGKQNNKPAEEEIKSAIRKHLNNEGEYVDFEEVKK